VDTATPLRRAMSPTESVGKRPASSSGVLIEGSLKIFANSA
jgi:hypothetical protein